jgi:hypothetical protein
LNDLEATSGHLIANKRMSKTRSRNLGTRRHQAQLPARRAASRTAEGKPARFRAHAADRWAQAVLGIIPSDADPRTLAGWGRTIGTSRGALRAWCRAAHIQPRRALDFARVLRSVVISQGKHLDLMNLLDVIDDRTLIRLLKRGGVLELKDRRSPPTVAEFISKQTFVRNDLATAAVLRLFNNEKP